MIIRLPEKVVFIIDTLKQNGYEAYAVGGCVRDSLLSRRPEDWDITTSADPYETRRLFARTIDTGIRHGTVTVMLGKDGFEVTTYRIDGEYEDGRHPKQVEFTKSLQEDLARRDFTINAMAYNDEDGLVDIFGGEEDLSLHRIRCVGDPGSRFDEDALRILRAYRFAAQLDFAIDEGTRLAAEARAENLSKISAERIHTELNKLLLSDHPEMILQVYQAGLTRVVFPEFDEAVKNGGGRTAVTVLIRLWNLIKERGGISRKEQLALAYAVILYPMGDRTGEAVLKRLKYDNELIQTVKHLIQYYDFKFKLTESDMRKAMNRIGTAYMKLLFLLKEAAHPENSEGTAAAYKLCTGILERNECVDMKSLAINGSDLLGAGFRQGREMGFVLNSLLELVLEEPKNNRPEYLLKEAERLALIQKEAEGETK